MRIADIRFDLEHGEVWVLGQYGFGSGYETSRFWECRDVPTAMSQDISETHGSRSKIPWAAIPVDIRREIERGGTIRVSKYRAPDMDTAQYFLLVVADTLRIDRDDLNLENLGKTMDLEEASRRLHDAAVRTMVATA